MTGVAILYTSVLFTIHCWWRSGAPFPTT